MYLCILHIIRQHWKVLTALLLVAISLASLWPLDNFPDVPGTDKTHHFIAYGVLVFPVALRKPRYWWAIALFFLAYSGVIELIQPYVNRYGEWLDLLANTGGILSGILLASGINYWCQSQLLHQKKHPSRIA